jgi:hypothetical protein
MDTAGPVCWAEAFSPDAISKLGTSSNSKLKRIMKM